MGICNEGWTSKYSGWKTKRPLGKNTYHQCGTTCTTCTGTGVKTTVTKCSHGQTTSHSCCVHGKTVQHDS